MTREEIAQYIKSELAKDDAEIYLDIDDYKTIVKALEQEPCDDTVSREAVLDVIEREQFKGDAISKIEKLPPVNPQESNWILVNERLPEECTAVLVWCPSRRNIYCAYYEEKQWWIFGAYWEKVTQEIIAWRPLPAPYKVENEDKE